ncbi:hypothetical protein AURDEDRAFT_156550 [Auricularia subglabra TFB-10046 SS5]|nr:hypothetical protein AURDEDRAFT_156550 [Auricularia subglabra TFB-10046 SS5]
MVVDRLRAPAVGLAVIFSLTLRVMSYVIAGRQVPKYVLSLGTYGSVGLISYLATRGGDKKAAAKPETPSFQSSSKDEEDFIKNFVAEAEKADAAH